MPQSVANREAESVSRFSPGELRVPRAREKPEASGGEGASGMGWDLRLKNEVGPDRDEPSGQCFSWGL